MMAFELKAEYEFRAVLAWHIVPEGTSRAICGTPLAPAAHTRPLTDLPRITQACRACEILSAEKPPAQAGVPRSASRR